MAATEKAIAIVPKEKRKIKEKVSKKLNRRPEEQKDFYPIKAVLWGFAGVIMILPSLLVGALTFFAAGFEQGCDAALKTYRRGMKG